MIWSAPNPVAKEPVARASRACPGLALMLRDTVVPGLVITDAGVVGLPEVSSPRVATPSCTEGSGATPAATVETSALVA